MTEEHGAYRTRCKGAQSIFRSPLMTALKRICICSPILFTLALCRHDASSYTVPSRFGCQPCGCRIRCRNALWPVVAFWP